MVTVSFAPRVISRTHTKQALTVSIATVTSVQYVYRKASRLSCSVTAAKRVVPRKGRTSNGGPSDLEGPVETRHDEDTGEALFSGTGQDRAFPHPRRQEQSTSEAAHG